MRIKLKGMISHPLSFFFAISGDPRYMRNRKSLVSQLYNIIVSEGICTSYLVSWAFPGRKE